MGEDKKEKTNIYKIIVVNTAILLAVFIVFCLSLENYARNQGLYKGYEQAFDFDPYSIYRSVPFAGQEGSNITYDDHIYINNNLGIRRQESTSIIKPPNVYRIIWSGGSGAWGMGVHNHETVNYYLEEKLDEKFKNTNTKFEVLNVAAPGYISMHNLLRHNSFWQHLSPDMVVIMDGHNDWFNKQTLLAKYVISDQSNNFAWAQKDHSLLATFFVLLRNLSPYSVAIDKYYRGRITIKLWSGLIGGGILDFVKHEAQKEGLLLAPKEDYETVFKKSVSAIYKTLGFMLKEDDIDFILALQPILQLREKDNLSEGEKESFITWRGAVEWLPSDMTQQKQYAQLKKFMPIEAEKYGAKYIDMHDKTKRTPFKLLLDYTHPTPEGNKLIADILVDEISPNIEKRLALKKS